MSREILTAKLAHDVIKNEEKLPLFSEFEEFCKDHGIELKDYEVIRFFCSFVHHYNKMRKHESL